MEDVVDYAGPERRKSAASDNRSRIMDLMRENPSDLGVLSVLLDISQAIESNTAATEEIAADLREHRGQYQATAAQQHEIISQMRGGNRVLGVAFSTIGIAGSVIVALSMWIAKDAIDDSREQGRRLTETRAELSIVKVRQNRALEDIADHDRRINAIEQRQAGGSRGP